MHTLTSVPLTVRLKQVIQVDVKCWGPVGVVSVVRHNAQRGAWAAQLVVAGLAGQVMCTTHT